MMRNFALLIAVLILICPTGDCVQAENRIQVLVDVEFQVPRLHGFWGDQGIQRARDEVGEFLVSYLGERMRQWDFRQQVANTRYALVLQIVGVSEDVIEMMIEPKAGLDTGDPWWGMWIKSRREGEPIDVDKAIVDLKNRIRFNFMRHNQGKIRAWLKEHVPVTAEGTTDGTPSRVTDFDLRFTLDVQDPNDPSLFPNLVRRIRTAPTWSRPRLLELRHGSYNEYVTLPPSGGRYEQEIYRIVKESFLDAGRTVLCFRRRAGDPSEQEPYAVMNCKEGGSCKVDQKRSPPGWIEDCEETTEHAKRSFGLITPAYASSAPAHGLVWFIPSLETMRKRKALQDISGIGYTEFEISSNDLSQLDADAFIYAISVNGIPVYVDGIRPELLREPFEPEWGFTLHFALQNLNFAGVQSGCDEIAVDITFLKDGKATRPPFRLKRPYVAIRTAPDFPIRQDSVRFHWTGKYIKPLNAYDYEVMIGSRAYDKHDRRAAAKIKRVMNDYKKRVDALGLSYNGQRIVGVIRPPAEHPDKHKYAYGLVLGMVRDTGQIQFTFDHSGAEMLQRHVASLRDKKGALGMRIRREIPKFEDMLIYKFYEDLPTPKGYCDTLEP